MLRLSGYSRQRSHSAQRRSVTDTVARWEEWTGLRFLETGTYVVPGAFQPIKIDVRRNTGRYEEANVWMRHPVKG